MIPPAEHAPATLSPCCGESVRFARHLSGRLISAIADEDAPGTCAACDAVVTDEDLEAA